MTKILVVAHTDTYETDELQAAAKRRDVALDVTDITEMPRSADAYDAYDVIYWRSGAITTTYPKQYGRATFAQSVGKRVPIVNNVVLTKAKITSKSVQQTRFAEYAPRIPDIQSIPTFLAHDHDALMTLIQDGSLAYPFIAKPNHGARGFGIHRIECAADIDALENDIASYVFQNYITNNGDYRVLVVGGVAHDMMLRSHGADSEKPFLNNISQGGTAAAVTDPTKRTRLAKAACAIAAIFDFTICGVDLIEDEQGNLYFLEINSVPQWEGLDTTTGSKAAEHILDTLVAVATDRTDLDPFQAVHDHYMDNLSYLPANLQLHFLSRLYLWFGGARYKEKLDAIRDAWWSRMTDILTQIDAVQAGTAKPHIPVKKYYRREATKKHPWIGPYNQFFFKCLFDRTLFDGTGFSDHAARIDAAVVSHIYKELFNDMQSVFALATPAVNFFYLTDMFITGGRSPIDPSYFLEVGDQCSLKDPRADLDSRIYMYTHAIIGASQFYATSVPEKDRDVYRRMLERIETLMRDNYADLNIDQKSEFAVCCRLCDYDSPLMPIIRSELATSLSPHGLFFVNTHNTYADDPVKKSLFVSEHANVLALMAFGGFGDSSM